MTDVRYALCAVLAAWLCACAGPIRYARQDPPAYTLSIWIDSPHTLLDPADALQGCSEWAAKGVVCRLAADRESADVVIGLHDAACITDKNGYRTLALAYRADSHIEFVADCFRRSDGYDRRMFRAVVTHEIGHVIGIWRHVPEKCDSDAPEGSLNRAVCGIAVMNAIHDDDVTFVTVIDALAFDARDTGHSALQSLNRGKDASSFETGPNCIYLSR